MRLAPARLIDPENTPREKPTMEAFFAIDVSVFLLVAALTYSLVFRDITEANQRAFDIALGAVIGSYGAVATSWRGSSHGSAEKQDALDARR
jgi:hypothetical protein